MNRSTATPERPTKRRSLLRWQEARLRRLDAKNKITDVFNYAPLTQRQRDRRHDLANSIMRLRFDGGAK